LDGIVAANTLHFLKDKAPVLDQFFAYLKPSGRMILVEYNVERGNCCGHHPPLSSLGAVGEAG
jgi:hypothetical protein